MIQIVIAMAGRGTRLSGERYGAPKPLIRVRGRTLFDWSVMSLPLELCSRLICVVQKESVEKSTLLEEIERIVPRRLLRVEVLSSPTRGQAETVLLAAKHLQPSDPLLIFNTDTFFRSCTLAELLRANAVYDGVLGAARAPGTHWSFAAVDAEGFVTRVEEKVRISEFALTGLYHFTQARDFLDAAEQAIASDERAWGEFYVAPLYNRLISRGRRYVLDHATLFVPMGTPEELEDAARALP